MTESSNASIIVSSDSIVLSSDDDEGVPNRPGYSSPDMFQFTLNSTLCSCSSPIRDRSPDRLITSSSSNDGGDDAVVFLDSPPNRDFQIVSPTIDPIVVEISDSDDYVESLGKVCNESQPPKEQPKKKRIRKKKTSFNLNDLEQALSEIALSDENLNKERLSFLSSLSERTFDLPVHPEASFYKANFKHLKEKLSGVLFEMFNTQVFNCGLPKDTKIEWSGRLTSTAGKTVLIRRRTGAFESSILLSTKILTTAEKLRDTLIHEMCHAAAWTIDKSVNANHGPVWKKWTKLATKRFPELPPIDVTHSYSIQYKYNWECQMCGHKVGRHKNTVDLNRHRCPFCFGRFERI